MQITSDKACEHAKTTKRQEDFPVEGTEPGLVLRVTSDGHKTWSVRYRRQSDGKRRRLSLGVYPSVGLKEARKRARTALADVTRGGDPAEAKQQRRAADSVRGLGAQWIEHKRRQGRAASYLKRSEERLAKLPKNFLELKGCDVRRADVTAALDAAANRGAKFETNRQQALISAVLKWAVSDGLLEHDPSHGIKRRFDEEARERVFTDAELKAFWNGIATAPASPGAKIAMRLCFVLGQRPKEIAHMRKDKLALDELHPTMTIEKALSKNRRMANVIPLPCLAVDLMRTAVKLAADSPWLFPRPDGDGPIDPHAFAKIVHRARDPETGAVFGIKDAQLYDSKKTLATFLGNKGHPDQFIGLLFGHLTAKTGTVTGKHYNHAVYLKQKREMIEAWAQHLEAVLGIERPVASNVVPMRADAGKSA